jgi:adenine/guanine phosphoribosyltransferase-like PRPP-binding protein
MQADAILPGQTVVIVDDIIATGARLCSIQVQAEI